MVEKVVINNNKNSPIKYLSDLNAFSRRKQYVFKPGVNIIIGENGSGKTTLLNLIKKYLLVDSEECSKGLYNSNINELYAGVLDKKLYDGVDVYADYTKNTFRLCHVTEKTNDDIMSTFESFGTAFDQMHASTGEGVYIALNSLFKKMFSKGASLTFDYSQFKDNYSEYTDYIEKHRVTNYDEWTILMDEPDRNLDIEIIKEIKSILSYHKPHTQIIAVIHNPLLICSLSKNKEINFIEMTKGYKNKVIETVNNILK